MTTAGWSSSGTARRFPAGLIGALVLIVGVERHIADNAVDYLGGSQWSYRVAARVAREDPGRFPILCFGDSLLKLGLAPRVVEAETGLAGYNFAVAGGQAAGSYFLLRHALEAGAHPRAIVVDFFPSMLATTPHFNDENLPLLTDLRDCLDLASTLGEPAEFARLALAGLLPSVRCRTGLRSNLALAFHPLAFNVRFEILRAIRNWRANRGAEVTASKPLATPDLDAWERHSFAGFAPLPAHNHYVERFLRLASSRSIPVFWVLPPYQPGLQERVERSGFDARHEGYVRAIQARHPALTVLDARHAGYDPSVFVDPHHLNRDGAAAFSAAIGRAIRTYLREPGSRIAWTGLPPVRRPSGADCLEDGEQSRVVVWMQTKGGTLRGRAE